jgi:hypothetical protein
MFWESATRFLNSLLTVTTDPVCHSDSFSHRIVTVTHRSHPTVRSAASFIIIIIIVSSSLSSQSCASNMWKHVSSVCVHACVPTNIGKIHFSQIANRLLLQPRVFSALTSFLSALWRCSLREYWLKLVTGWMLHTLTRVRHIGVQVVDHLYLRTCRHVMQLYTYQAILIVT